MTTVGIVQLNVRHEVLKYLQTVITGVEAGALNISFGFKGVYGAWT